MSKNHLFYINSFKSYEPALIQIHSPFSNLSNYSTFINDKANEIFILASSDSGVNIDELQREIIELGILYVKLFVTINRQKSSNI